MYGAEPPSAIQLVLPKKLQDFLELIILDVRDVVGLQVQYFTSHSHAYLTH